MLCTEHVQLFYLSYFVVLFVCVCTAHLSCPQDCELFEHRAVVSPMPGTVLNS